MSIQRILLIKPSRFTRYNPTVTFPLGLMYIASYLRRRRDYNIRLINLRNDYKPGKGERLLFEGIKIQTPNITPRNGFFLRPEIRELSTIKRNPRNFVLDPKG